MPKRQKRKTDQELTVESELFRKENIATDGNDTTVLKTGKHYLTSNERKGLHSSEILLAERALREAKGINNVKLPDNIAISAFELFLVGASFREVSEQFEMSMGRVIAHAAINGWLSEKENLMLTIQNRVKGKVIKAVSDQVDFLTTMLAISCTENMTQMKKYLEDPTGTPPPAMRIKSMKEYKEVSETLQKVIATAFPNTADKGGKQDSLFNKIGQPIDEREEDGSVKKKRKIITPAMIINQQLEKEDKGEDSGDLE